MAMPRDPRPDERPTHPGAVEDYAAAALVSFYVAALIVLGTVWAAWGFLAALGLGALAERALARLARMGRAAPRVRRRR